MNHEDIRVGMMVTIGLDGSPWEVMAAPRQQACGSWWVAVWQNAVGSARADDLRPYEPMPAPPPGCTVKPHRAKPKIGDEYWMETEKQWAVAKYDWHSENLCDSTGNGNLRWVLEPLPNVKRWIEPSMRDANAECWLVRDIPLVKSNSDDEPRLDTDAIELAALEKLWMNVSNWVAKRVEGRINELRKLLGKDTP